MQLDLFCDNRRTILLNEAGESLRALDLEKALAVYADLLNDAPNDRPVRRLQATVGEWRDALCRFRLCPTGSERLHDLWSLLTDDAPAPLAAGVLDLLIAGLQELPEPELIYVPPRFHVGALLMVKKRHVEAEYWFSRALKSGIAERGRFLGWQGDALTMLRDAGRARGCYLAAFLEGPHAVDLACCKSGAIQSLLTSLENENAEEIEPDDLAGWLPVWGWLRGEFPLSLAEIAADREAFAASLAKSDASGDMKPPRLWFHYLRYAEHLRAASGGDPEMVRARRRLREMNRFMFDRYMEKVRGL